MTPCARVIRLVRLRMAEGLTADEAARKVRRDLPRLCGEVDEIIGCWPSSEPELRAMQRTQGGR